MIARPDCADPPAGELLAAYELGLLPEGDRARFEAHAAACESCEEELFAGARAAVAAAAWPQAVRVRLAGDDPARAGWRARVPQWLSAPRLLVPAASAVLLLGVLVAREALEPGGGTGRLARVEPLPYTLVAPRAAEEAGRAPFDEGMAHYLARRYRRAAEALAGAEAALPPGTLLDQARLYRGVSLLLDGDPGRAVASLEAAARSPVFPLADRARWYLAQAWLAQERPEAAVPLLEILGRESPVYAERALRQLESLPAR